MSVSDTHQPNQLEVSADHAGARLDRFVRQMVPGASFGLVQKLARKGALRVNGKRAKADARLDQGDLVFLPNSLVAAMTGADASDPAIQGDPQVHAIVQTLRESLVLDQDDLIAFNKPSGLAVQGGSKTRVHVDGVLAHFADAQGREPKLIHRLDRDTSGLLLTARGALARELAGQFADRSTKKRYLAWCWGCPAQPQGTVDAPLGKAAVGPNRQERVRVDAHQGQAATSVYRVVHSDYCQGGETPDGQRSAKPPRLSLIEWRPLTGRTHQLRVHAEHLGNAILGDLKYGQPPRLDALPYAKDLSSARLMLHALSLEISVQGRHNRLIAPIPDDFKRIGALVGFDDWGSFTE